MGTWEFQQSGFTIANRKDVWVYWSDFRNHAKMEPAVERIELDGPFASGTKGRTVAKDFTQEWEVAEVVDGRHFVITGLTPDGAGSLSFAWEFEDEGTGTRMTHRITATGPAVEEHIETFRQMEVGARKDMARLASELDRLAS
jgi:Polyketide cyclase / dehydrase and lipid transport